MAGQEAIDTLRRMTGEVDSDTYTDIVLGDYIDDADGDLDVVATTIWNEKASIYADLVDITEAGSSRKNTSLFEHAVKQRDYYAGGGEGDTGDGGTTTRRIVRA